MNCMTVDIHIAETAPQGMDCHLVCNRLGTPRIVSKYDDANLPYVIHIESITHRAIAADEDDACQLATVPTEDGTHWEVPRRSIINAIGAFIADTFPLVRPARITVIAPARYPHTDYIGLALLQARAEQLQSTNCHTCQGMD